MALRAGSVGLGREAGLGARRGWTRRRRPPHARGALPRPGPLPRARVRRGARRARGRAPSPSPPLPSRGGVRGGAGGAVARRACASLRVRRAGGPAGLRTGAPGTRAPGGPAAAATLDASRALPVDRPSCGGRRGRPRGARRAPRARACAPGVGGVRGRGGPLSSSPTPAPRRRACARGLPPPGPPPGPRFRAAPRLGRRLAADLELVRTRGIRLFN